MFHRLDNSLIFYGLYLPFSLYKRNELTKKVWEDNGVFVGWSLDTDISKLRKILKDDTSITITNIHGIG